MEFTSTPLMLLHGMVFGHRKNFNFTCMKVLKHIDHFFLTILVRSQRPLEHSDQRFESLSLHDCVSIFLCRVMVDNRLVYPFVI